MIYIYTLLIGTIAGVVVAKIDPKEVKFNYLGTIIAGLIGAFIPAITLDFVIMGDARFPIIAVTEAALSIILATINALIFASIYRVIYRGGSMLAGFKNAFGYSDSPSHTYKTGKPAYAGFKDGKNKENA